MQTPERILGQSFWIGQGEFKLRTGDLFAFQRDGVVPAGDASLRWEIAQSLRSGFYFLAAAPGTELDDAMDRYDTTFSATDMRRGQELYRQLGCRACHQLGTVGGYVGPELTDTGSRLRPGWIAAWLTNPETYKPGTLQPDYGLSASDARALTSGAGSARCLASFCSASLVTVAPGRSTIPGML